MSEPEQPKQPTEEELELEKANRAFNNLIEEYIRVSIAGDVMNHNRLGMQILAAFTPEEMLKKRQVVPPHALPVEVQVAHLQGSVRLMKKILADMGAFNSAIKAAEMKNSAGITGPDGRTPASLL